MTASRLMALPLGTRVVVRYLIENGDRATDALGYLLERDDEHVVVETRRGPEQIVLADVLLAKPVPPPPAPRPRRTPAPPSTL